MIGFFRRLVDHRHLPPLPDDDLTIEKRWPRFCFVDHPGIRAMQRKCLMRAEHMRAFPGLYPVSFDDAARERRLSAARPPVIASPSSSLSPAPEPYEWAGIEATAPASVRRHEGEP